MKNKLIIIFFLSGFWHLNATEIATPKTNFEIFTQLTSQCLQEILAGKLSETVKKVALESVNPTDSLNWFVENALFNFLNQRGVDSILIQPQTGAKVFGVKDAVVIRFSTINLGLSYETESRWRLKGTCTVKRHFDVQLFLQIIDQQHGTVLWSGHGARQYSDHVSEKQIQKLESSSVRFTRAKFRNRSIYSQFVEPLIVISTTGAIIYLFYSFRSR